MSIKVMSRVWENSRHKGSELLVLLAMADNARNDGICWPSVVYLAEKSRLSVRQTERIIARLLEGSELELVAQGGGHQSNKYRVTVEDDPRQDDGGTPVAHDGAAPSPMTGEPSRTVSNTPDGVTADIFVAHVAEALEGSEVPLTGTRRSIYGKGFKLLLEQGHDERTLRKVADRIAERWLDPNHHYKLTVEQALGDVLNGKGNGSHGGPVRRRL